MASNFAPGVAVNPKTDVQLSVSCKNLLDKDVMSKSDPMCVLFMKDFAQEDYREVERSDVITNSLNPEFSHIFHLPYFFEQSQRLKFEIYDVDSRNQALSSHDFLGMCECSLGEVVAAPNNKFERPLKFKTGSSSSRQSTICIRAEEVSSSKELVNLHFQARKLDKKDFLGKSDPYLVFSRANEDSSFTVVHRTEVIKNTLNPDWRPFSIKAKTLCNGDAERCIRVECYDWDNDGGSHDLIGTFQTTLSQLKANPSNASFEVINPKKKAKKKGYHNSGTVQLLRCTTEMEHSFLDFIQGGMQMNFTVAIDFTASNGDPRTSSSLHYMNPYQPNQYMMALQSVGKILQDYDTDKMFPALGFGAKLPPNGQVSHEFFLNGNPNNPFCVGLDGLMAAYQQALHSVQLYGPTNFSPVINHVARMSAMQRDGKQYCVLLILTDGIITDMDKTVQAVIDASYLPMSIIIVGVGQEDFKAMEFLDSDNQKLQFHGKVAQRDIVQFVPMRQFLDSSGRPGTSEALLAQAVLAEVPEQVVGYMKSNGIKPGVH